MSAKEHNIAKDDIVWAPWRGKMWPSKVTGVYPLKISYVFFPLETDGRKGRVFSAKHSTIHRLCTTDKIPEDFFKNNGEDELLQAWALAALHLKEGRKSVGSNASEFERVDQKDKDDIDWDEINEWAIWTKVPKSAKRGSAKRAQSESDEPESEEHDEGDEPSPKKLSTKREKLISDENELAVDLSAAKITKKNSSAKRGKKDTDQGQDPPTNAQIGRAGSSTEEEEKTVPPKRRRSENGSAKKSTNQAPLKQTIAQQVFDRARQIFPEYIKTEQVFLKEVPPVSSMEIKIDVKGRITDEQAADLIHSMIVALLKANNTLSPLSGVYLVTRYVLDQVLTRAVAEVKSPPKLHDNHAGAGLDILSQVAKEQQEKLNGNFLA